jgi:hypothetical protein
LSLTASHSSGEYHTESHSTTQCHTLSNSVTQHHTVSHSITQCHTSLGTTEANEETALLPDSKCALALMHAWNTLVKPFRHLYLHFIHPPSTFFS